MIPPGVIVALQVAGYVAQLLAAVAPMAERGDFDGAEKLADGAIGKLAAGLAQARAVPAFRDDQGA